MRGLYSSKPRGSVPGLLDRVPGCHTSRRVLQETVLAGRAERISFAQRDSAVVGSLSLRPSGSTREWSASGTGPNRASGAPQGEQAACIRARRGGDTLPLSAALRMPKGHGQESRRRHLARSRSGRSLRAGRAGAGTRDQVHWLRRCEPVVRVQRPTRGSGHSPLAHTNRRRKEAVPRPALSPGPTSTVSLALIVRRGPM